ncbi:MAG: choice-of-anchor Q domain-containing protein [Kiritimatiellales bacterium]
MKKTLIFLTVLLSAVSAFSVEYYVDASRPDDSGDGASWTDAKQSIQAALDVAANGDTVWVTNGAYFTGSGCGSTNADDLSGAYPARVCITNAVTVRSVNGAGETIILGSSYGWDESTNYYLGARCAYLAPGATLEGFTLTGAYLESTRGAGVYFQGGGTLNHCVVSGNSTDKSGGGIYCNGTGTLNNCTVAANSTVGMGGGAYLNGGTMNNCLISENSVSVSDTNNFSVAGVAMGLGSVLNNCTVVGNWADNYYSVGGVYFDAGGTVNNCIVWGNRINTLWYGGDGVVSNIGGSGGVVRYTCSFGGVTPGVSGCITNNPLFEDAGYRLSIGSPCIDAGTNGCVNGSTDLDGSPRIINGRVDMGAYEATTYYTLTVSNGTGSGMYTNGAQVAIAANAPATGKAFSRWIGDTQVVDNVTYTNALVTISTNAVSLTATYTNLSGWYILTVSNGIGGGTYTNGARVMISAAAPGGTAFDRWGGDTQCVAGVFSLSTLVTMPAQNTALTATCVNASNGIVHIGWSAMAGFYFSADPNTGILAPVGSGKSTIAQLMYSPDNVKDSILAGSKAGAVNDVVWDTIVVTNEWADFSRSTKRAWTNGYAYALIFQDNNVQSGDWYYSTPLLTLTNIPPDTFPQLIDMNTDPIYGDPINGSYGRQVVAQIVLTGSAGAHGTVSPANAIVLSGGSANFVITAGNYYRIATLTQNGTNVPGLIFNNGSTATNFIWSNVQTSGVLAATFTAQVVTNPATSGANVPYEWLAGCGLTNYEADSALDPDSDGLKTWQEYIVGTNPTNATSVLKATQNSRNTISWNTVSGRVYSVYFSTNLMNSFQPLATNIPWTTGAFTDTVYNAQRQLFYKVNVQLAP